MKICLISPYLSTDVFGLRIMAALLRRQGHQVRVLFMPDRRDQMRRHHMQDVFSYPAPVSDRLVDICRDAQLVGITLMTQYFDAARQLTESLRAKTDARVVWGGIHATVRPEEALRHAHMVCVGEGEVALVELARRLEAGEDAHTVPGIWSRTPEGEIRRNGAGEVVRDLDSLPFPEYNFEHDMLLQHDAFVPFTREALRRHLLTYFPSLGDRHGVAYQLITSRGCPYSCTFCGEVPLDGIYGKRVYCRRRSVDNFLAEIEWAQERLGPIQEVCFCDDSFLARPLDELADFSRKYKQRVGLPLYCLVSPANVTEEKVKLMVDAGLRNIGMGIQSGSERMLKIYNRDRFGSVEMVNRAVKALDRYRDRVTVYYDFMHEDPYETDEDLLATLSFMASLPKGSKFRVYSLVPFPGTDIYEKAKRDGWIRDEVHEVYRRTFGARHKGAYLNFLVDLVEKGFPRRLLRVLIDRRVLRIMNRRWVGEALLSLYVTLKRAKRVLVPEDKGLS